MTHPTSTDQAHDGDAVENFVIDDAAAPQLAAIQQGYEEARASIIDPTIAPLNWVHDPANAYPETEAIDVDALPPPLPHDATPPTEAMSMAAKHLAEQDAMEEAAASAQTSPRAGDPLGLRRWWRAFWTP
jgi:hypothetical protein